MTLRHTVLFLISAFVTASAFASDVPGSGVTEFVNQLALGFGGLGLSGLAAGACSGYVRRSAFVLVVSPVCAFAWMYFASHEYERYGNMGVVLVGLIPYALCYFVARFIVKANSKKRK